MSTKFLIIVSVLVFSLAIFLGLKNDQPTETKAEPKKETKVEKKEEMHVYEEEEAAPEKGAASQDENYSKETLDQTKKLAMDFVKVFHEFDAAKPLKNIENSKKYMSK